MPRRPLSSSENIGRVCPSPVKRKRKLRESPHVVAEKTSTAAAEPERVVTPGLRSSARSSHVTPHRKPNRRQLNTPTTIVSSRVPPENRDVPPEHFGLINKTWRVYRASPLFNFDPSRLKQYSSALALFIKTETLKGIAVDCSAESADQACFSTLPGLKMHPDEADAVEISLRQKAKSGESRVVLSAVLCCVQASDRDLSSLHKRFTLFPVLLIKGPVTLASHLTRFLESQFDCHISLTHFSTVDMCWMVAMWAGFCPDKGAKPVQLTYSVPASIEGLDTITIEIDPADCAQLWKSIHKETEESFLESEVVSLIKALEQHFIHHFGIIISAFDLSTVGTSTAFIGAEARIKIFSVSHLKQVLAYLTKLSLEKNLVQ